jgi:tetratricopeptide (TPR) repeat protein
LKDVEAPARRAAQKALELDGRLPEAYVAQASIQYLYDWDWKAAENSLLRALELDANNLDAHHEYASLLVALDRFPEALTQIQIAEQLDPVSAQVQSWFAVILYRSGKLDEAIQRLNRAIELEPRNAQAHGRLGEVHVAMGRYTEALTFYDRARVLRGNNRENRPFLGILATVYARVGRRSEAIRILERLGEDGPAVAYAALGDRDEAFRRLFRVVEQRENVNIFIKNDPALNVLHSDPRWAELMRRMNFPIG